MFKSVASAFGPLAAIAVLLSLDDFGSKGGGSNCYLAASRFYDCSGFAHSATSYRFLPLARRVAGRPVERFLSLGWTDATHWSG